MQFITTQDQVEIRDKPSFNAQIVGTIGKGQEVIVTGQTVSAEGWIWHEVEGGGLWIIEHSEDNNPDLVFLRRKSLKDEVQFRTGSFKPPKPTPKGRFTTQGMQFLLDGKPFRFVGVNVRELAYYGYKGWGGGQFTRAEHVDIQLQTARDMQAQVFRMFAPHFRNAKGMDKTDTKEAVKRIKKVLDKAEKLNLFALITLDDAKQSGFNVATDITKFREPSNVYNTPFYYEGYKEMFLPFVKALVKELNGHPALFAWGVCNESQIHPFVPPTPPIPDCQAFLDYYKQTTEAIKEIAPSNLVTTSIECSRVLFVVNAYGGEKFTNRLYQMPSIDFVTIHSYQNPEKPENFLGHNHEEGNTEIELARSTWKKPVIVEEMGPVGGKGRGDGSAWVAGALEGWFKLGVSGCMQWGFSAVTEDIGVGDADSGMHNVGDHPNLPGQDWGSLFNVYQSWGKQFWVGE